MATIVAVLATVLAFGIPFAQPTPPARLFNVDELEMSFSVLDRFLGVAPTNLAWPGGPLQLIGVVVVASKTVVEGFPSVAGFTLRLAEAYRHPWATVWALRCISLIVVGITLGLLAALFPTQRAVGRVLVAASTFVALTSPELWVSARSATADAMAVAFAALSVGVLLSEQGTPVRWAAAGVLVGLAIASRVPIVIVLPLLVCMGLRDIRARRQWPLFVALTAAAAAVGFLTTCPYTWTDPIRLAKSIVGNLARGSASVGIPRALETIVQALGMSGLAMLVVGVVGRSLRRDWLSVCGICLVAAGVISSMASAGVLYPRYAFPMFVVALVFGPSELGAWAISGGKKRARVRLAVAWAVVGALAGGNVLGYRALALERRADVDLLALEADLKTVLPGAEVIVPWEMLYYVTGDASSESLREIAASSETARQRSYVGGTEWFRGDARARLAMNRLPWAFTEDEQALAARLMLLGSIAQHGHTLRLWGGELAPRFGLLSRDEAIARFESGFAAALVVDVPLAGLRPHTHHGRWAVYFRGSS